MRRIAFFLASLYCLAACDNAVLEGLEPDIIPNEPKSQIELRMPDVERVNVYSTATASENMIDTVWVLVYNNTGTTKKWVGKIEGKDIVRNGTASQILPQLGFDPDPGDNIICLANVAPVDPSDTIGYFAPTPTVINKIFKLNEDQYYEGLEHLPMSGSFIWAPASGCVCEMTRAVAKIQVQMGTGTGVSDATGNFSADNVTYRVYSGAIGGTILPTSPISGTPNPNPNMFTSPVYLLQNAMATEANMNVYLHEYPTSNTTVQGNPEYDSIFNPYRQHIIIEKDNGSNPTTYYRLDFYDRATEKFIDTKRNHHYLFTINKIRSEGYLSALQARNNPGSNIEYTVRIEDGSNRFASNGQYAIVVSTAIDTLTLYGSGSGDYNLPASFLARYQLPEEMASLPAGTRNEITVRAITGGAPGAFTLTSASPQYLEESYNTIPFQISVAAGTPSGTLGAITFHVGNINYDVIFRFVVAS